MATLPVLDIFPTLKDMLVVAQADGRLYTVDFSEYPNRENPADINWNISISKIILARLQHTRTRLQTLEELEFENVVSTGQTPPGMTNDYEVTIFGQVDGGSPSIQVNPTLVQKDEGYLHYATRVTAKNFSIQLRGTYNINTISLTYHLNGKR